MANNIYIYITFKCVKLCQCLEKKWDAMNHWYPRLQIYYIIKCVGNPVLSQHQYNCICCLGGFIALSCWYTVHNLAQLIHSASWCLHEILWYLYTSIFHFHRATTIHMIVGATLLPIWSPSAQWRVRPSKSSSRYKLPGHTYFSTNVLPEMYQETKQSVVECLQHYDLCPVDSCVNLLSALDSRNGVMSMRTSPHLRALLINNNPCGQQFS